MNHARSDSDSGVGDNTGKAEPKHLRPDTSEPCPRPDGCTCTWTPLTLGWSRGPKAKCPVH